MCVRIGGAKTCEAFRLKDHHAICFLATLSNGTIEMGGKEYTKQAFERELRGFGAYSPSPYVILEASDDLSKETWGNLLKEMEYKPSC